MSVLSTQPAALVEVTGLEVTFGHIQALCGVDIRVRSGDVHVLLGSNGAGKSTLVRVVTTLQRATGGRVRVCGLDVMSQRTEVRQHIAVAGQGASLDEALTGEENLEIIGGLAGLPRRSARTRASELLDQVGLKTAGDRAVKTYSGGMRRRLDLAASLIADPEVLVVDEPTTGLDPVAKRMIWGLIRERATRGCAVLLTTQDLTEAQELATFITVLNSGHVIASGTPTQLRSSVGPLTLRMTTDRGIASHPVNSLRAGFKEATQALDEDLGSLCGVSIEPPDLTDVYLALTREN